MHDFLKNWDYKICGFGLETKKLVMYANYAYFFSSGIEDNPTVFYRIIRGSTDQTNKYDTFYLQQRKEGDYTYADIKVNHPLDYERIKEYNLTVRVEVSVHIMRFLIWTQK